jgi:hypothetical protein
MLPLSCTVLEDPKANFVKFYQNSKPGKTSTNYAKLAREVVAEESVKNVDKRMVGQRSAGMDISISALCAIVYLITKNAHHEPVL